MIFAGYVLKVFEIIHQEEEINIYKWRKSFLSDILLTHFYFSCLILYLLNNHKQPLEVFYRKSCSKENICVGISCLLEAFSPATLLKRDSNTRVFLWILRIFLRTPIFKNTCERLLLVNIFRDFLLIARVR